MDNNQAIISKLKKYLILYFSFIGVAMAILATMFTFNRTNDLLKEKVSALTLELTSQIRMNVEKYFRSIETTSTLIFATEDVHTYDAEHTELDEYDALATENKISNTLFDLCIMENYVDFGIVYSNNHTVGKISNGTAKLFGDGIYEELSSVASRERTTDGWATGCHEDYKRIYYVKRVNEYAVFVASVYTTELANVFKHPTNVGDITVRLTDENFVNMYSSIDDEIGLKVPDYVLTRISGYSSASILDDEYLITINNCDNNWFVICSIPTLEILKERNALMMYVILVILITCALGILLIIFVSKVITNPVSTAVTKLNTKAKTDQLTGILNKISFEEICAAKLNSATGADEFAMLLMDVDDFKGVNDTFGHAVGDKVLSDVGKILRENFRENDCIGRLGGDEFGVMMVIPNGEEKNCNDFVIKKCERICAAFHDMYLDENKTRKVSVSIGVSVFPSHGNNFDNMYKTADKALYKSKQEGKDTYNIYDGETENEQ